jgi:hypothetical protein
MEPEQIVGEIRRVRRHRQSAVAIFGDDIVDDRAGLAEHLVAVAEHRRGAHGMQRLIRVRGQPRLWVPRIDDQIVVEPKLLTDPDNPLGLRNAEMMDGEEFGHGRLRAVLLDWVTLPDRAKPRLILCAARWPIDRCLR